MVPVLAFAVYMQMFSSSMRRLPREMMKPYVYLVPGRPSRNCSGASGERGVPLRLWLY